MEISNAPSISVHFSDTDGAFIKSSFYLLQFFSITMRLQVLP